MPMVGHRRSNVNVTGGEKLGLFDRVFVRGNLIARQAFVENGRLTGIIDWSDARIVQAREGAGRAQLRWQAANC